MTSFSVNTETRAISVDGKDVSDLATGVAFGWDSQEQPHLTLYVQSGGTIEGDGVVTVVREPTEDDLKQLLAEWLLTLDVDLVEAEAQKRFRNIRQNQTQLILQVLSEMAHGN